MAIDLERIDQALNTRYWVWKIYKPGKERTLVAHFVKHLTHIPASSWPERFEFGGIYVNGILAEQDGELPYPCKIEYYEPRGNIQELLASYTPFDPAKHIIFEDNNIIMVFKPARLHSMPAKEQRIVSLFQGVSDYVGKQVHLPSRLDFSTSGIVVISKKPGTHGKLQQLFEQRKIQKYYVCEVTGKPEWREQLVDRAIWKDNRHPILRRTVDKGGQKATTLFNLLGSQTIENQERSLFLAKPFTGRTHQIRVHSQYLGFPLIGDNFYGGAEHPELHLLAYALRFKHPLTHTSINCQVPEALLPEWVKKYLAAGSKISY